MNDDKLKITNNINEIMFAQAAPDDQNLDVLSRTLEFWQKLPASGRQQAQQLFTQFTAAEFPVVQFSLKDTLQSPEYVDEVLSAGIPREDLFTVLLMAAATFLFDVLSPGEKPTPALLLDALRRTIRLWLEAQNPEPIPAPNPPVAELYSERQVARVFKSKKPDMNLLHELGIRYVFFQPEIAPGKFGHDIRGLAFKPRVDLPPAKRPFEPHQLFVLLETGEHLVIPDNALNLAGINDAEEYDKIPPVLLLQSVLAAPLMARIGVLSSEHVAQIQSSFGDITKPVFTGLVDTNAVFPLEPVFVTGSSRTETEKMSLPHVTGPSGAMVRFIVPGTAPEHVVILNARLTPTSYYLVSSLSRVNGDADDTLLMRNDIPRQLSPYGVYVFPREDALYALLAFPENLIFN